MDRGRTPADRPDDVEAAAEYETIDPTADARGSSAPSEASDVVVGDVRVDPPIDGGPPGAEVLAAPADDTRPAAWLADIRTRAPWLLERGGALHWRVTGTPGPDVVPHGLIPPAPSVGGVEAIGRAEPRAPEPWPVVEARPRERSREDASAAGAGAGHDDAIEARPRWPEPIDGGATPVAGDQPPAGESESRPSAETAARPDVPDRDRAWIPSPLWPADETPRSTSGRAEPPDAAGPAEHPDILPGDDPSPGTDPRRPTIHRPSATWPPSPARPAAASPVWPPRPHPERAGLPHPGPVPEPSRTLHRPVTPFVPDHPAPLSPAVRPPAPTWAEDRTGWHAAAVPVSRLVDETALAPWPSLLDDDDSDEDEPDWTDLERGFQRMLRLEREQRRR